MKTYNKMEIDFSEPVTDIITVTQNDSKSRYLDVVLFNSGVPTDLTGTKVRIVGKKQDGTRMFNDGIILNHENGRCEFELTSQMLSVFGILKVQIKVFDKKDTEILTTQPFNIFISEDLYNEESIESSNEYGALIVIFQNVYDSTAKMEETIQKLTQVINTFGNPSGSLAALNIDTFWKLLESQYDFNKKAISNSSTQGVLDRIGEHTDSELLTVFGTLNYLKSTAGGIKSKQVLENMEDLYIEGYGINGYKDFTISNVNPEKTVLIGEPYSSNGLRAKVVNPTIIRIYASEFDKDIRSACINPFVLQIIEFY